MYQASYSNYLKVITKRAPLAPRMHVARGCDIETVKEKILTSAARGLLIRSPLLKLAEVPFRSHLQVHAHACGYRITQLIPHDVQSVTAGSLPWRDSNSRPKG